MMKYFLIWLTDEKAFNIFPTGAITGYFNHRKSQEKVRKIWTQEEYACFHSMKVRSDNDWTEMPLITKNSLIHYLEHHSFSFISLHFSMRQEVL